MIKKKFIVFCLFNVLLHAENFNGAPIAKEQAYDITVYKAILNKDIVTCPNTTKIIAKNTVNYSYKKDGNTSVPFIEGERVFFVLCRNKDTNQTELNLVKEVMYDRNTQQ